MSALSGRIALVLETGPSMTAGIADGLSDAGADVRTIRDGALTGCAEEVAAALAVALDGEAPALAVLSILAEEAMSPGSIAEMDLGTWRKAAVEPMRIAMRILTALGEQMKPRGEGAVVFLAPSLHIVGAAGLTGLTAALEGQRGLMKSVARQWGSTGVTVNWASAAPVGLSERFEDVALPTKGDAVPIALSRRADARSEIAGLGAFLASPAGRGVTGATLMCDGGEWMVP